MVVRLRATLSNSPHIQNPDRRWSLNELCGLSITWHCIHFKHKKTMSDTEKLQDVRQSRLLKGN